ncbi:hypothetical protein YT14_002774 [Salmonella enterica subsp. enterica serovar Oslo]|nr:hypothetical protein [Salmonella enterica subsp. enterica serovar Oslo]
MISNDVILNTASFIMLALLLFWGVCFFIFTYKKVGGPKVGKESLLYFNFMFFKRDVLSTLALSSLVLAYVVAAIAEFRRGSDDLLLIANLTGSVSFVLFGIYGRYFYQDYLDDKKPFFFIKVFLSNLDLTFNSIFLWLSRIAYFTWVVITISR